jgi:curli biogenesis system outer membrane secretion channel CsgG
MKHGLAVAALALILGCRGGEVRKEAPVVELNPRTPKPFNMRKKMAVVDFADKTAYGGGRLGTGAADVLTTFLVECQQFRVMERQQIAKVLEEQKFQQSGAVDQGSAVQAGKILGVEYVVYGVVTNFGLKTEGTDVILYQQKEQVAEAQVDVRLINVETSEIHYAKEGRGTATAETRGAVGLGGRMSYDETLAGKSLRAAIVTMVDALVDSAP